jgi:hypothetical protein
MEGYSILVQVPSGTWRAVTWGQPAAAALREYRTYAGYYGAERVRIRSHATGQDVEPAQLATQAA